MSNDTSKEVKHLDLIVDNSKNLLTTKITHGEAYNLINQYKEDQKHIDEYEGKILKLLNFHVVYAMAICIYLIIMISILLTTKKLLSHIPVPHRTQKGTVMRYKLNFYH